MERNTQEVAGSNPAEKKAQQSMHLTLGQRANLKHYQGCNIISADGFTVPAPARVA